MEKKTIAVEQIMAEALLLGFDRIDSTDITIFFDEFLEKNPNYTVDVETLDYISKYIKNVRGRIFLKDNLNLNSHLKDYNCTLKKRLEQIAGSNVIDALKNFNLEEFILIKINHYGGISCEYLEDYFCKIQMEELNKLEDKGYIESIWKDEAIYDNYKVIRLSDFGKRELFKYRNAKEMERFTHKLQSLRYDVSILDGYLLRQDLKEPASSFLNIDEFDKYCNDLNITGLVPGVTKVCYDLLGSKEELLDKNNRKLLNELVYVWDFSHSIYICHPNDVFRGPKTISEDVKTIKNINWDDIDIEMMLRNDNKKKFTIFDSGHDAIPYIYKRLGDQITENEKHETTDSLVIVEEYPSGAGVNYLVRGIIKFESKNGYSVAFNPEYKQAIPTNNWDWQKRIFGQGEPAVYFKKRNFKKFDL